LDSVWSSNSADNKIFVDSNFITCVERVSQNTKVFGPLLLTSFPIEDFDGELEISLSNTVEGSVFLRNDRDRRGARDIISRPSGFD
jgi:hypothetical protein